MPQMVNPLLARVQALAGQYTAGDRTKETKKSFSNALRRLSSIFQILDDQRSDGCALPPGTQKQHPSLFKTPRLIHLSTLRLKTCAARLA